VWEQLKTETVQAGEIEHYWNTLMQQYGGWFPDGNPTFQDSIVSNGDGFSISNVLQGLLSFTMQELLVNSKLMALIIILTVFSVVLETMHSAFERTTVSKVASAVTHLVIIVIAINSFRVAIGYAKEAISDMVHFMMAMIPLILTMLASLGNLTTVSILHPLIVFMIHTVGNLIHFFVFPLLFFSAVLFLVSSLSDQYKITQLANLLRTVAIGTLTISLTVFLGVISVQGATGSVTDGVALKTAKFLAGNFVPVVGRMFSDATDTVLGASLLMKNAIGIVGVLVILLLSAFPAIKILALAAMYHFCAAILQPLGDNPIIVSLQTIGKSMIYVFAALASVGLMFFMAVTIIIAAGNITVMLR
jgi:stage III sporulation protein AE